MPIASLGFRTDIMLLALGGSAITKHGGLTVVSTPPAPDFWWGNFVLAPASALDAAVALHAEMFPEADFVSVGIDGTDGALGIDAAAAGRGLTVERSTALSSTAVCLPPRPNTDAEVRRLHSDEDFEAAADLQYTNDPASGRGFVASRFRTWRWLADEGHGAWFGASSTGGCAPAWASTATATAWPASRRSTRIRTTAGAGSPGRSCTTRAPKG